MVFTSGKQRKKQANRQKKYVFTIFSGGFVTSFWFQKELSNLVTNLKAVTYDLRNLLSECFSNLVLKFLFIFSQHQLHKSSASGFNGHFSEFCSWPPSDTQWTRSTEYIFSNSVKIQIGCSVKHFVVTCLRCYQFI